MTGTQDPTKQVSKNEWNDDPDDKGLLGFTGITKVIATGALSPTDTVTLVDGEGAANDDLDFVNFGATNDVKENDIILLFKGAQIITVRHNVVSPPANHGAIMLLAAANKTLSANIPLILQRRGTTFYEIALTGGLVDALIAANAGVALSKLAALTASRALASDAGGVITASTVTAAELAFLSGVTSAIQTQLNGKASTVHAHAGEDITVGTVADARLPTTLASKVLSTFKRLIHDITALTFAATTDLNFDDDEFKTLSLTGNITFTTSNRATGKRKTIRIICDATQRTFTFPAGWKFLGVAAPANIAANKTAILSLTCFGTLNSDIVVAYAVEP